MAYVVPKQWNHGDRINSVAELQAYSDGQVAINAALASFGLNFATPYSQYPDTQDFYLVHRKQFLVYVSTGVIKDLSGINSDISLSTGDGVFNSYDLDTVHWIFYGGLYRVIGCSVCMEDDLEVTT